MVNVMYGYDDYNKDSDMAHVIAIGIGTVVLVGGLIAGLVSCNKNKIKETTIVVKDFAYRSEINLYEYREVRHNSWSSDETHKFFGEWIPYSQSDYNSHVPKNAYDVECRVDFYCHKKQ